MKIMTSFASLILLILSLSSTQFALAKPVDLYDQPKTDAKVIGTIDLSTGVIPIFKSADQLWVKVGDPKNGNVGWIKSSDIDTSSSFSYTQKVKNGDSQSEQTIKFGILPTLTPKEREEMYKKIEIQQKNAKEQMNNALQNMLKEMNTFLQNFPLLLPGVVETPFKAKPTPTTETAPKTSAYPKTTKQQTTPGEQTKKPEEAAMPSPVNNQ